MAIYAINNEPSSGQQNLTSTYKTLLGWSANTTPRRAKIYDITIGTNGLPADNEIEWDWARQTVAGTATSVTPQPLDPADSAASGLAYANATAEGTVSSSSLLYVGMNQRASYRWVASPGSELVIPATNVNGIVGRARAAVYTSTATMSMLVQEQ